MSQSLSLPFPSHRRWLLLILAAFLLLGLLYELAVPFFEKPDELKHFAVIHFIETEHRLPQVQPGVYKPWDQEGTQPPLYHLLAAATVSWLNLEGFEEPPRNPHYVDDRSFVWRERGNNNLYLHSPGERWQLDPSLLAARLARWLSLLAGLLSLSLTYALAAVIFTPPAADQTSAGEPKKPLFTPFTAIPLLAVALMAFIPQFLHVSTAITNDSLTVTLAAASLLLLALIISRGATLRRVFILGLLLGLGAITKLSLLYFLPLSALVLCLDFVRHRRPARLLTYGAVLAMLLLLLSGWWFWHNWQLYGDPTALSAHLLYRGGPLDPTPTLAQLWQTEIVGLELSFWAAFGAGQILLEPWLYRLLRGFSLLALAGILLGCGWGILNLLRRPASTPAATDPITRYALPLNLGLLALWSLLIVAALFRWMQITPASWGRLLYPALPALAVLAAWGLLQLPRLAHHLPQTASRPPIQKAVLGFFRLTLLALPWLVAATLFGLSLLAPFRYMQTAYAKPPLLTAADLPPDVNRVDLTYGNDELRLLGYRLQQPTVQPGHWLPVTLYWQAVHPIDKNYSAFVHLLDAAGQSLAQSNSYPAAGRWPTSMLPPGAVLADTHHIYLPPDAPTPLLTRLAIGIFEFEDPARAAKPAVNQAGVPVEPIFDGVPLVPDRWPTPTPAYPLTVNFNHQLQLIGYDWLNESIQPGEIRPLTLYWQTLTPPGQDLNLFIHLIDPKTQAQVAGFDGPPAFPTSAWQAGAVIVDQRQLQIPATLPSGEYELRLGWYNLENFARLPLVDGAEGDALLLLNIEVAQQ